MLLLSISAYATLRAVEKGSTSWLVHSGAVVGVAFVTKMLQVLIAVPVLGAVYLFFGPPRLANRVRQLLAAQMAVIVGGGRWVAAVQLTPAADRPYVGGSTNDSVLNLEFGYNEFGRITGNETGSVGGATGTASPWGPTGWDRLFRSDMGGQIRWLTPTALLLLAAALWVTGKTPRTNPACASILFWGGWLLLTGAVFSFAKGIIHP